LRLHKLVTSYQHRIVKVLNKILPAKPRNILHQAMRYSVLNGGKRLRPILVYITGKILHAPLINLDIPASAVELIHCYSLIHDDLPAMDNANLRRGKLTCHKKFNEATAILAGDALQSLSFNLLSKETKMLATLTQACMKMAEGQMLDISTHKQVSLQKLTKINSLKTGALIEASVILGAIAAGCQDQSVFTALSNYAQCVGIAFQIRDDILDIEGSTKTLGKTIAMDKQQSKSTYPTLLGIAKAKQKMQHLHTQAITHLRTISLHDSLLADLAGYLINRKK
jgi:geranylgeranyl pyrophosphate synthase